LRAISFIAAIEAATFSVSATQQGRRERIARPCRVTSPSGLVAGSAGRGVRGEVQHAVGEPQHQRGVAVHQAQRAAHDRVERGLRVAGRAADGFEDRRGRCLLLQRFLALLERGGELCAARHCHVRRF
jgi:hypothetical protein